MAPYPSILVFLGIDGSGKSTHARAIHNFLRSEGKRVKYVWMRRIAYSSLPLLGLSRALGITRVRRFKNGAHWISEYPFYAYRPLQLLWPLFQLADSLLHTIFSINLPLLINPETIIVVDRGIIDTLVDVTIDAGFSKGYAILESLYVMSIPKNSYIAVFDIDEKIAMQRKSDIPSIRYLELRRKLYLSLAKRYNWPIFSTEADFVQVHKSLLSTIRRNFDC